VSSLLVESQATMSALSKWRAANRWADSVPFEQFPQKYREEIESQASISDLLTQAEAASTVLPPEHIVDVREVIKHTSDRNTLATWHHWGWMTFEMAIAIHDPFYGRNS
jgi:hypothetical protein